MNAHFLSYSYFFFSSVSLFILYCFYYYLNGLCTVKCRVFSVCVNLCRAFSCNIYYYYYYHHQLNLI